MEFWKAIKHAFNQFDRYILCLRKFWAGRHREHGGRGAIISNAKVGLITFGTYHS